MRSEEGVAGCSQVMSADIKVEQNPSDDNSCSSVSERTSDLPQLTRNKSLFGRAQSFSDTVSSNADKPLVAVQSADAPMSDVATDQLMTSDQRPSELVLHGPPSSTVDLLQTPCPAVSPRNKSPVTVQEWVDSLPVVRAAGEETVEPVVYLAAEQATEADNLSLGAEAGLICGACPSVHVTRCVGEGASESGSHCSSVESLLEARRPDPEEVLLGLGFGGTYNSDTGRIPQRFMQPSKLKGVAIDDFLRHQQDLVHTFETGFCGYRGLTGPSHSMPSVIVAKIMEKLKDHERENSSIGSPPQPHNNNNNDNNKFSKVAHNVLTKIRCVPGSVLTPDNRRWLDSQGDKSPEIARKRIIIGQQSFTFNHDGDLIESPPSSLTDSDRWTSSTGHSKCHIDMPTNSPDQRLVFPSIEERQEAEEGGFRDEMPWSDQGELLGQRTHDMEERLPERGWVGGAKEELWLVGGAKAEEVWSVGGAKEEEAWSDHGVGSCHAEPVTGDVKGEAWSGGGTKEEEAWSSLDEVETTEDSGVGLVQGEASSYDKDRAVRQYQDLCSLIALLKSSGVNLDMPLESEFTSFSVNERCGVQCRLLRSALAAYGEQLAMDEVHLELRSCLRMQVQRVADLLDTSSESDKLVTIVRQMTMLLHHQAQLRAELRELTADGSSATSSSHSCQDVCQDVMSRVRGLESIVQRNAQELAEMKARLLPGNT